MGVILVASAASAQQQHVHPGHAGIGYPPPLFAHARLVPAAGRGTGPLRLGLSGQSLKPAKATGFRTSPRPGPNYR